MQWKWKESRVARFKQIHNFVWPGIKSKAKESSLDTWAAAAAADASMKEKWHAQYPRNGMKWRASKQCTPPHVFWMSSVPPPPTSVLTLTTCTKRGCFFGHTHTHSLSLSLTHAHSHTLKERWNGRQK